MANRKYCTGCQLANVKGHFRNNDCSSTRTYSFVNDNNLIRLRIDGLLTTIAFQRARLLAENLHSQLPLKFTPPQIRGMLQVDWHVHFRKLRLRIGGKLWMLRSHVAVFVNNEFLGSDVELLRYIDETYIFNLPVDLKYYESLVAESLKNYIEKSKRTYVYVKLSTNGSVIGSLLFMLYTELMPITCQYFMNLCTVNDGKSHEITKPYYVNTLVHRIVKNGWIQCGKQQVYNDKGSSANIASLPDESYCIPHNRLGVLSLSNNGKHRNRPQFIVCLKANPWMNCYYTAFGQLVDGIKTLHTLENIQTYYEAPVRQIEISECGEFRFGEELKPETDADIFLDYPAQSDAEDKDTESCDHL